MTIGIFLFSCFILFMIILYAVKLAISPLIDESKVKNDDIEEAGLINLYNMGVLSDVELHGIIEISHSKNYANKEYETYLKYSKVLNELRETHYFTEEAYNEKIEKLKDYYGIK